MSSHLYNYGDKLWLKYQLDQTLFTGVIAHKNKKEAQIGPEPKKRSGFFWIKSKTTNTQKMKLDTQKVDDLLTHGGNLNSIWAQKIFFDLILQEFCYFSETWDLWY